MNKEAQDNKQYMYKYNIKQIILIVQRVIYDL